MCIRDRSRKYPVRAPGPAKRSRRASPDRTPSRAPADPPALACRRRRSPGRRDGGTTPTRPKRRSASIRPLVPAATRDCRSASPLPPRSPTSRHAGPSGPAVRRGPPPRARWPVPRTIWGVGRSGQWTIRATSRATRSARWWIPVISGRSAAPSARWRARPGRVQAPRQDRPVQVARCPDRPNPAPGCTRDPVPPASDRCSPTGARWAPGPRRPRAARGRPSARG